VPIEPFDPVTAPDGELAALHDLQTSIAVEAVPDDEVMPRAFFVAEERNQTPIRPTWYWVVWDAGRTRILASAWFEFWDETANRNLGSFGVQVRPEARRQGLASALLQPIVEVAAAHDRTLLDCFAHPIAAAAPFLQAVGASHRFTGRRNALDMAALDLDLLHSWVDRAKERAADYVLEGFDGPCPDDRVDAFVAAQAIMNTAPREDFEAEDDVFTVEALRALETRGIASGIDRWVVTAVHRPTGVIAGYTEVFLPGLWPTRVFQGDTGVDVAHRNHGLGRWLKAVVLLRLLDERPDVTRVVTFNAGSNEPMLNINHALGFRCIEESTTWQVPLDRLVAYLGSR
jgi:mycothiol synthase